MDKRNLAQIFLYTGTGNTFRVAKWIADSLEKSGYDSKITFINGLSEVKNLSEYDLLFILFPTHGFMPPWSMIKFLFKMPKISKKAVICATRGAVWAGPLKIPGAAGFAHFFAALILLIRGLSIKALFSIDMPANMINFHPSLKGDKIEGIKSKSRLKINRVVERIIPGKRVIFTLNNLYELLCSFFILFFIPSLPILYLLYGKLSMAKIMFSNNNCNSCGECSRFCPNNGIKMKDFLGKSYPFWTLKCENCMRCMAYCKRKAVEAGHSWAVLQYFIVSYPLISGLILYLSGIEIKGFEILAFVNVLYFIPALILSYRIFWLALRIPFINTLFCKTTLTHYYKRFHDPETSVKELLK